MYIAFSVLACKVEVGVDVGMMRLEYCSRRPDWTIVRSL